MKSQKNKQGFTLVELIVVLVILAILAALLVPALTGYIDRAREKKLTAEAKGVWTAAQAAASEYYGLHINDTAMQKSMTNSCTINGKKYTKLGRISNATLSDELQKWHTKNLTASQMIGQQVLIYLESTDKTNPQYQFGNASVPRQGQSLKVNMQNNFGSNVPENAVFIQIFYDENCRILALNFGKEGYLVTMTEGQDPVCEKNGKVL